jgi:N,N'-diacetyllegionaminate synthase
MRRELVIAGQRVGAGNPCFVIGEAGVNHNGDLDLALKLVDVAATADASAVKFQTFNAAKLVSRNAPMAKYQIQNVGAEHPQYDMLRPLELTRTMHVALSEKARLTGVLFLSTPFDEESVDLLDGLGMPAFKIGSGDLTHLPLLRHVARKGKPMIVSTGMSRLGEVETALQTIEAEGNDQVVLLHCVSSYPAHPADVNLRAMATMAAAFGVPVGYSDHTIGIEVALAAVALGATVIEKHITLDRTLPGPDHVASLEPPELAAMIRGIRAVEAALGDGVKRPVEAEKNTAEVARRSLVAAITLPSGALISREHVAILRPGNGMPPSMLPQLIGRRLRVPIEQGCLFAPEMLD